MSVTLRKATDKDSEFAYQTKKAAFREYAEQVWGWDETTQRDLHEKRIASQDFRILLTEGTEVGVLAVQKKPDHLHVYQIFILPDHQSQGVGKACMNLVVSEARDQNLPIELQALNVNPAAIGLYEQLGFVKIGKTVTHTQMRRNPD